MKHAFFDLDYACSLTKDVGSREDGWTPTFFVYRRLRDNVEVITTSTLEMAEKDGTRNGCYLGIVEDDPVRAYHVAFPITKDPNGSLPEANYQRDRAGAEVKAEWFNWDWVGQSDTVRQSDAVGGLAYEITNELKRL